MSTGSGEQDVAEVPVHAAYRVNWFCVERPVTGGTVFRRSPDAVPLPTQRDTASTPG